MTKRILEIITFPFYLLFQFISFPFKIVKIGLADKKGSTLILVVLIANISQNH